MSVIRIFIVMIAAAILCGFTALGVHSAVKTNDNLKFQKVQLKSKTSDIQELNIKYDKLNVELNKASQDKNVNQDQIQKLQQEKTDLENQKTKLESELQAKIDSKNTIASAATEVVNTVTATSTASAASLPESEASAKAWLYSHESGDNPGAVAPNGACGLGQALPCSKLPCGLADYGCQDTWFTGYMVSRYGTWAAAKASWISRATWNGSDWRNGWW